MHDFRCRTCDSALYFENSACVTCGSQLGFSREEGEIVVVADDGVYVDSGGWIWHRCRNLHLSGCTWLSRLEGGLCFSCELTRTRPNDDDAQGLTNFLIAERAKRRLVFELDALKLPLASKEADPDKGLCFDLLSSVGEHVTTGHDNGVITIDLAESNAAYIEQVRMKLDEPYRTMLGHFRHEVGHYYEWLLVDGELLDRARRLFGDDSLDYQVALDTYYANGAPDNWRDTHISTYATMHPFEDFAESFAHYLHITDTIDTARAYGLTTVDPSAFSEFRDLVRGVWVPLSIAFNQINLSMGKDELYPFVLAPPVLDKLDFVDDLVKSVRMVG